MPLREFRFIRKVTPHTFTVHRAQPDASFHLYFRPSLCEVGSLDLNQVQNLEVLVVKEEQG